MYNGSVTFPRHGSVELLDWSHRPVSDCFFNSITTFGITIVLCMLPVIILRLLCFEILVVAINKLSYIVSYDWEL